MNWTEQQKRAAWEQARPAEWPFDNPDLYRRDVYGRLMYWDHYGNRSSPDGWEMDHVVPISTFEDEIVAHLLAEFGVNTQALNWRSNAEKSDTLPSGVFGPGTKLFDELTTPATSLFDELTSKN